MIFGDMNFISAEGAPPSTAYGSGSLDRSGQGGWTVRSSPPSRGEHSSAASPGMTAHPRIDRSRPYVIATINREQGDTGVHAHTRALQEGLTARGANCAVQTPFAASRKWLAVFAMRRAIQQFSQPRALAWYRKWHEAALREALVRQFHGAEPAAIIAQCPVSASAALAARRQFNSRVPIAMVCHFNYSEATEYRDRGDLVSPHDVQAMLDFERRTIGAVDRVIYVSRWAQRVVERERGIEVKRSSVIWNGISAAAGMSAVSRESLGLLPTDLVLVNVGTLEPRKNQIGLLDLFSIIASTRRNARLLLVGDGPHRSAIEARIRQHNLGSKVRLLGMRDDVPAILGAADMYVHFSDLENCPVALIEAARAALPIAAVSAGGVGELLEAFGGISLPQGDSRAAYLALRGILGNPAKRQYAGRVAYLGFVRSFTREAMADAYLKVLDATAGPGASR